MSKSSSNTLAKRYARAFFALAKEQGLVSKFDQDLQNFHAVLELNGGELLEALNNPILKIDERKDVVLAVAKKLELHDHTTNFLCLVIEKRRSILFPEISVLFQQMVDAEMGRVRVQVTTAVTLSDLEKDNIIRVLASSNGVAVQNLVPEYNVQPDLIGGIIAKIGDRTYDASVRSKLENLSSILLS